MIPDDTVRLLENSAPPDAPPNPPDGKRADATKALEARYNRELEAEKEREVHSYPSLHASRQHALALLDLLPDFNKTQMATQCLEQEIKLQESIRNRSYSDSEFLANMRRYLTLLYGYGGFGFGLALMALPYLRKVESTLYQQQVDFAKWLLGAGLAASLTYFFRVARAPTGRGRESTEGRDSGES